MEEGEWVEDDFVGDYTACNAEEAEEAKQAAISVASTSRMFMYKPDSGACVCACALCMHVVYVDVEEPLQSQFLLHACLCEYIYVYVRV
jgi:hypothetical protein